jgi:transposase InsO family protein
MIRFIDEYRDRFGVEFLCCTLRAAVRGFLTSRGYRAAKARSASARQLRDELLLPEIRRLHAKHYGVYGRRKMHALLKREGWKIGRDQTERLMRLAGVGGVRKSKRVFTTRPNKTAALPADLVNRRFAADGPRKLWVCDVTYVATWSGFAYVAFVTDVYSRRIVGWNVAATLKSEVLPMQALDMAAWQSGGRLDGLIHHADHGSNYTAIMVYTDRIAELGAVPSTGTVGDSFDNAMAEAVNNLYKTELIRQQGPGGRLSRSNSRPSNTCGGGTMSAFTGSSICVPRSRSSRPTMLRPRNFCHRQVDRKTGRNSNQANSLGCITTIITDPIPGSVVSHRQIVFTTSRGTTPRGWVSGKAHGGFDPGSLLHGATSPPTGSQTAELLARR